MWLLMVMLLTPTGQIAGYGTMPMPDHETCMVMGDRITQETSGADTYHCVDMAALMAQGVGS